MNNQQTIMKKQQQSISAINHYTLAAHLVGFLALAINPIFSLFLVPVNIIIRKLSPKIMHNPKTLFKLVTTTFIFGLINGYTFLSLVQYFNQQPQEHTEGQISTQIFFPVFPIYLSLLTIYHFFQMQLVNCFHHSDLCWSSFLIYHSPSYTIANASMIVEHIITRYLLEFSYKLSHPLMIPALIIAILSETLRISAFFTCRRNFTHNVMYQKRRNHQLVTNGVYSFFRHPSYTGYFYFVIFGQILIGNFICAAVSFYVLRKFFNERIQGEQQALARFFSDYPIYRSKTHIFIPFVKNPDLLLDQQEYF